MIINLFALKIAGESVGLDSVRILVLDTLQQIIHVVVRFLFGRFLPKGHVHQIVGLQIAEEAHDVDIHGQGALVDQLLPVAVEVGHAGRPLVAKLGRPVVPEDGLLIVRGVEVNVLHRELGCHTHVARLLFLGFEQIVDDPLHRHDRLRLIAAFQRNAGRGSAMALLGCLDGPFQGSVVILRHAGAVLEADRIAVLALGAAELSAGLVQLRRLDGILRHAHAVIIAGAQAVIAPRAALFHRALRHLKGFFFIFFAGIIGQQGGEAGLSFRVARVGFSLDLRCVLQDLKLAGGVRVAVVSRKLHPANGLGKVALDALAAGALDTHVVLGHRFVQIGGHAIILHRLHRVALHAVPGQVSKAHLDHGLRVAALRSHALPEQIALEFAGHRILVACFEADESSVVIVRHDDVSLSYFFAQKGRWKRLCSSIVPSVKLFYCQYNNAFPNLQHKEPP